MALYLITGKPGVGKTNLTLTEFLKITGRPLYACDINEFDYDAHNVTHISHFNEWINLPDRSALFVDECQNYLRASTKVGDLPKWVTDLETHRHRGIDIYITTQHPSFIHIHFRRLTEHHTHYHRFAGAPIIQKREWSYCAAEPNDREFVQATDCTKTTVRLNKETFKKYKSTELDTHKFKIPAKLIKSILLLSALAAAAFFIGYPVLSKYMGMASHATEIGKEKNTVNNPSVSDYSNTMTNGVFSSADHKLTIDDFTPVHAVMPWSAPFYRTVAAPTDFPRFSGCMQIEKKCKCYTQQGTILAVDTQMCNDVISGDAMPFNPFPQQNDDTYSNNTAQTQIPQQSELPEPGPPQTAPAQQIATNVQSEPQFTIQSERDRFLAGGSMFNK